MASMIRVVIALWLAFCGAAAAQEFSALARVSTDQSEVRSGWGGAEVVLHLSQPVPYRVFTLDNPARLVVDFREALFADGLIQKLATEPVATARAGRFQPGWSRLVMELSEPLIVAKAGMQTGSGDGTAVISVSLEPTSLEVFASRAGAPPSRAFPEPAQMRAPPQRPGAEQAGPVVIVIDPGHGGIDPGAVRGDVKEADLVLGIAQDLANYLLRTTDYEVVLTREDDRFVSLEARITIARRAGADLFMSLHADAIAEGTARGAQIYTFDENADDAASIQMVERHERGEILAGVDLTGQDDRIAAVLLSLARSETAPRSVALADALVAGLQDAGVRMHRRARDTAAFSVLKAPDVPSVLVEIGFLSSPEELAKLQDPAWRAQAIKGIALGIGAFIAEDAARAPLVRQ